MPVTYTGKIGPGTIKANFVICGLFPLVKTSNSFSQQELINLYISMQAI